MLMRLYVGCHPQRVASDELGISEQEMDERLQQLGVLLPGLQDRLAKVRVLHHIEPLIEPHMVTDM